MSQGDKDTLDVLERIVMSGANPRRALETAYQLGKFAGGLEMAQVQQNTIASLRKATEN